MATPAVVTPVGYFDIRSGKTDQFRASEEMMAMRRQEPGHLASAHKYRWGHWCCVA